MMRHVIRCDEHFKSRFVLVEEILRLLGTGDCGVAVSRWYQIIVASKHGDNEELKAVFAQGVRCGVNLLLVEQAVKRIVVINRQSEKETPNENG